MIIISLKCHEFAEKLLFLRNIKEQIMTKKEFIAEVQKSCHLDMQQCMSLTDNLQKMLGKAAVEQVPVLLSGLGVFVSHKHPEYIQEESSTGIMTLYPPRISYRMCTDEVEGSVSASLLLSEFSKVSEEIAESFLNGLVATVNQHLAKGEEIQIPGIGVFKNILTHQSDLQHLSYIPDQQLKDLVNTPFSCFEPFVISEGTESVLLGNEVEEAEIKEEEVPAIALDAHDQTDVEETPEESEEETVNDSSEIVVDAHEEEANEEPADETIAAPAEETTAAPAEEPKATPEKESASEPAENINQDASNNYLLYVSLSLILICSLFLFWLIFSDDSSNNHIPSADVVEEEVSDVPEDSVLADNIVQNTDSLPQKEDKIVEEVKKPEETKKAEESMKPEETKTTEESKTPEEPKKTEVIAPEKSVSHASDEFHRLLGADGKPVTVTLEQGERLTLLALRQFGDKAFWPYIFDVNADKLKTPDRVQAGMKLYLPDPKYYQIDANNAESLRKAKNRGAQLLK